MATAIQCPSRESYSIEVELALKRRAMPPAGAGCSSPQFGRSAVQFPLSAPTSFNCMPYRFCHTFSRPRRTSSYPVHPLHSFLSLRTKSRIVLPTLQTSAAMGGGVSETLSLQPRSALSGSPPNTAPQTPPPPPRKPPTYSPFVIPQ